ncbi:MAG: hypothetical protein LBF78_08115, partial [Treponema sp.]|nr:hypothetical protein [Treponema sp.]
MLNEIIYTRCGTGRDLLKKGAAVPNQGYKCHSCSEAIFSDGSVLDFQFLRTVAGIPHPFSEPGFVDDAYLYYVPEKGKPLFQNFHPIPDSKGRAGNFISQIFVGDLGFYPCEAFGSRDWDAKLKSEDYYYGFREDAPPWLIQRKTPLAPGKINFEAAGRFISQGRSEILKAAVWFLFKQYALPPEDRKYLIIKDTTENIELWIAAIEYAFPPETACTIPFATRMTEAAATGGTRGNRYFIGANGLSAASTEENPEKRLKAMIVGIDVRDQAVTTLRVLPAYPYCLLDGMQKTVLFEADDTIGESYFSLITTFSESHKRFIAFLSDIPGLKVSQDIISLYHAYRYLYLTDDKSWTCAELVRCLELFLNYKNLPAGEAPVKKAVSHIDIMLQQDEANGYRLFNVLRKLKAAAEGDLCAAALKVFQNKLISDGPGLKQSLELIKTQPFAQEAFSKLTSDESVGKYQELIARCNSAQGDRILETYREALKFMNQKMSGNGIKLITGLLEQGIRTNDREGAAKIIRNFIHSNGDLADIVFPLAVKYRDDPQKSDLLWERISVIYTADISEKEFALFCRFVKEQGFTAQIENLLCDRIKQGGDIAWLYRIFSETYPPPVPYPGGEKFFREIAEAVEDISGISLILDQLNGAGLDERVLVSLYDEIDEHRPVIIKPNSLEDKIGRKILLTRPKKANCTHSRCGILLSNIFSYSRQPEKIKGIIVEAYKHGQISAGKNFA